MIKVPPVSTAPTAIVALRAHAAIKERRASAVGPGSLWKDAAGKLLPAFGMVPSGGLSPSAYVVSSDDSIWLLRTNDLGAGVALGDTSPIKELHTALDCADGGYLSGGLELPPRFATLVDGQTTVRVRKDDAQSVLVSICAEKRDTGCVALPSCADQWVVPLLATTLAVAPDLTAFTKPAHPEFSR